MRQKLHNGPWPESQIIISKFEPKTCDEPACGTKLKNCN